MSGNLVFIAELRYNGVLIFSACVGFKHDILLLISVHWVLIKHRCHVLLHHGRSHDRARVRLARAIRCREAHIKLGRHGEGMQFVGPITSRLDVQPQIVWTFGRRGNAERMPLVFGNRWYVDEDVVARIESKFGRPLDHQMGHLAWQYERLLNVCFAIFVRWYLAEAKNVLKRIQKQRYAYPEPKVSAMCQHDEQPRYRQQVNPEEHLEVAALTHERHREYEYDKEQN